MITRAIVVLCALSVAGCGSNDCVATTVGSCQAPAEEVVTPETPDVPGLAPYGAKPSGAHISLDCRPYNVPAFSIHDCLYSHWHGNFDHAPMTEPVDCTMKLADRDGLVIGDAKEVQFKSEAGAVSPIAASPAYDATKPVSDQKDLGHAVGFLEVFGAPLPADQTPLPGELSHPVDFGCGLRTANPRDGFVTVIAYTAGEEGFVDGNVNGQYDPGEAFVDVGEPFVDANDSGAWEPPEWYADVNGDGQYTGPNGAWDADTVIWTEARVIYSGLPWFAQDASGNQLISRYYTTGTPPDITPAVPLSVNVYIGPPSTYVNYQAFISDANLNTISPLAKYEVTTMTGKASAKLDSVFNSVEIPIASMFRLLYCDRPGPNQPTQCLDGPVEYACRSAPCYVVPEVGFCRTDRCSGLTYGTHASLRILPGSLEKDQPSGVDAVHFSITLDDIITWMPPITVQVFNSPAPAGVP